ncbi:hypothetical protein PR202_gb22123 [Eleusine coracana subsp. coracana]|uniref:Uncharacterized protein n=1 Tax=Eleusine coracana subsp. coracana TaxID=191504 RepID=A0AAV5FFF5_ELECO|nr:hypothetical protein PR202_gb22123 [Eleusine coracana subsp. coracana]
MQSSTTPPLLPFYERPSPTIIIMPTWLSSSAPPRPHTVALVGQQEQEQEAEEPPLLEELGIDIDKIRRKAISVLLHPIRAADPTLFHAHPDLSGPLLILLAFTILRFFFFFAGNNKFLLGVALWWFAGASAFI